MTLTVLPTLVGSRFTPIASCAKTPAEWQDWHSLAGEAVQLSTYLVLFWKETKSDAELFAIQKMTGEMLLGFCFFSATRCLVGLFEDHGVVGEQKKQVMLGEKCPGSRVLS